MENTPKVTIRTHSDEMSNKYRMVLSKPCLEDFQLEAGAATYTYPLSSLCEVVEIVVSDQLRQNALDNTLLLIESNLCGTKDTRGKHLLRDMQPVLELLFRVKSIKAPPRVDTHYV